MAHYDVPLFDNYSVLTYTTIMEDDLKRNLTNIITSAPRERQAWLKASTRNSNIHRDAFSRVRSALDDFQQNSSPSQWFIMPGIRGVGKSTILTQLYLDLPARNGRKFFLSLERIKFAGAEMKDVLAIIEEILEGLLEMLDQPVYIFLDEVQYLKDWALGLKIFFDRIPRVFIVCTGSSVIELQSNPDVARRSLTIHIHPLDFKEYIVFKQHYNHKKPLESSPELGKEIEDILLKSDSCQGVFSGLQNLQQPVADYWQSIDKLKAWREYRRFGSLPFLLTDGLDEYTCWQKVNSLLAESLNKDVAQSFDLGRITLESLPILLRFLAESDIVSIHRLSRLSGLNKRTIVNMLAILADTNILNPIKPLGSIYRQVNRPSKYLFSSPAMRLSLVMKAGIGQRSLDQLEGRLVEDVVGMYLRRVVSSGNLYYDAQTGGAGFVIGNLNKSGSTIVLEVGSNKNNPQQVAQTMGKIKARYGLVVTNTALNIDLSAKTVLVPFDYFLLI